VSDEEITPPAVIRIKEGPHGRGVYARRDIAEGETIEICPTVEIDESDAGGILGDFVISSNVDADRNVLMLGYGSLYNHSFDASAEYEQHTDDSLAFVATREIAEGEEITINYGEEWWETRGLEPG
jgi:uncharacterized protein